MKSDLQEIRGIVREEVRVIVKEEVRDAFQTEGRKIVREEISKSISTLDGKLEALENDVKDMYEMISELQKLSRRVAHFEKYDLEQKILTSYKQIVAIAKEAEVKLPPT